MPRSYKEYRKLIQSLLPKGAFWTKANNSNFVELLNGLGEAQSRIEGRSEDLRLEAFSQSITETLEEWENDFGIPAQGFELAPELQGRRGVIAVSKIAVGQQDSGYFIEIAGTLNWIITITEFPKSLPGLLTVGDSIITPEESVFYWMVNVWVTDPNRGNINQLAYELSLRAPGHTQILFRFYNVAYSNAYDNSYNAVPWWDGSWYPLSYDRSYSNAYANNSDYDGVRLIGAYSQEYSEDYNAYRGGSYNFKEYSSAYEKPAYNNFGTGGAYSSAYSSAYSKVITI